MGQIHGPSMGSPAAIVSKDGRLHVDALLTGSGGYYYQDKATSAIPTIEYEHHEIHDGDHYNIRGFTSPMNSGLRTSFEFTTPNGSKWTHLVWEVEGTTQTEIKTWEGANLSGGLTLTAYNNNRNSNSVAATVVRINPVVSGTVAVSGTLIEAHSKGLEGATPSKASLNATSERKDEWILKSGTTYLFEIKSVGANNVVDYNFNGYDHTDRIRQW